MPIRFVPFFPFATHFSPHSYVQVTALIIENTYTSVPDYVRDWDIIGPFSFLSTNRWNSGSKIFHIPPTLPIMFCSGRRDRLIRPVHMDNLWELAKQRGKIPGKSARRWFSRGFMVGKSKEEQETEEWAPPKGDKFIEFLAGDFCKLILSFCIILILICD